jgi:hypothetical protein
MRGGVASSDRILIRTDSSLFAISRRVTGSMRSEWPAAAVKRSRSRALDVPQAVPRDAYAIPAERWLQSPPRVDASAAPR